jgi:uncharacterized HAD superfamily protein
VKNIGIDIDGVVADFNAALAHELGYQPVHRHPDRWDWPQALRPDHPVDAVWERITNNAEWWCKSISPYAEAAEWPLIHTLKLYQETGNLYFITSRPQVADMKMWTEQWLKMYLRLHNPTVILAADKGLVAAGIGLTHFLDDNADNCTSVAEQTAGRCATFILHRPYNAGYEHRHVARIHTLNEFRHAIGDPDSPLVRQSVVLR